MGANLQSWIKKELGRNQKELYAGCFGHRANWPAEKMILAAWFDHVKERFSYTEVRFRMFYPSVKTSCRPVEYVNEPSVYVCQPLFK